MHIEPGLVTGAKALLGAATATTAGLFTLKLAATAIREQGIASLAVRSVIATAAVFTFFEVLPHHPVGVSEVHFILGSTLYLLFGAAPAAIGLALGLLIQGLFLTITMAVLAANLLVDAVYVWLDPRARSGS